jgi:putative tryptophan/tyrosine transport system substrate-binding protein
MQDASTVLINPVLWNTATLVASPENTTQMIYLDSIGKDSRHRLLGHDCGALRMHASRRRLLQSLGTIGLTLAALESLPACGKAQANPSRIGYLTSNGPDDVQQFVKAFVDGLTELGYTEGQNMAIEYRYAGGDDERLFNMAMELVSLQVAVIVSAGLDATRAAQRATTAIPIVFGPFPDPIAAGFVASLARPGGNLTGVTNNFPQLSGKQLELLTSAFPDIIRAAVLSQADNSAHSRLWQEMQPAADKFKIILDYFQAKTAEDIDSAFEQAARMDVQGWIFFGGPFAQRYRMKLVEGPAVYRVPAIYSGREFCEMGGLMAYGVDVANQFRRKAAFVDKILKGISPAELPVERPVRFDFVLNLETARRLGLDFPTAILSAATGVIR